MPVRSLESLAYKAIPRKTYHAVRNTPAAVRENAVLDQAKANTGYRTFKEWTKSVKKPNEYIRTLLEYFNYYTKADNYIAYNKEAQEKRGYYLHHVGDYWDELTENLKDKILSNNQISEEKTQEIWNKLVWPNILEKTYYCLCYKRLRRISNIKKDVIYWNEYDTYMSKALFKVIDKMPDSDNLPLIIYMMIDSVHKNKTKYGIVNSNGSISSSSRSSSSRSSKSRSSSSRSSGSRSSSKRSS